MTKGRISRRKFRGMIGSGGRRFSFSTVGGDVERRKINQRRFMRIATYNFLGGGSGRRNRHWPLIREVILPDLLFAQECRPPAADAPGRFLWQPAVARGWGTGLFARNGTLEPISIRNFKGWVVGAVIHGADWVFGTTIAAFSIHCPAGEHGYIRTMHTILDRLSRLRRGWQLVLGGDFNVACGYRAEDDTVRMSRGEREILDRLSGEFALIPCWQAANPGRPLTQTLRWSANRLTPYHCDGIFIPAGWRSRLSQCDVLSGPEWEQQSDHNPVLAIVETPPAA